MLAWLALSMLWTRHSVWWFPNLMATTFGGDPALHTGFGKYSAAGVALHLLIYSAIGMVYAFIVPDRATHGRLLLSGVLLSLAVYFFMYGFFWKHVNPLIPLYSPDRQLLVAHVFFGMMLSRYSRYAQSAVWVRS